MQKDQILADFVVKMNLTQVNLPHVFWLDECSI